ncbi:hypothetical protein BJF78_12695 [Pseudonocardia sp. CNS-139]|nr:hypothetical protein BJF78_12695 [Pseudonocardia sp. CNS-139]
MLSERERRTLARIERHLADSDPALARVLASGTLPRPRWAHPPALLVSGLLLLVFGSVIATLPVAVLGIGLAMAAMLVAHHRPSLGPA